MTGEEATEHFRLFVAITVPDEVRENMLRVQRELQSEVPPGVVRWTRPEQFHLTLRFLGDVPSGQVAGLQQSLRAACAGVSPLPMRAQGVGFFPNARSPRVIWVGITDGASGLLDLQQRIERAVQPFAAEPGGERFAGHVTLGRLKPFQRQQIRGLVAEADTMTGREFGEWTSREIELIRSELLPAGPRYTSLAACQLGERC